MTIAVGIRQAWSKIMTQGGPRGTLLYSNPHLRKMSDSHKILGFHGTVLSKVDGQLKKGRFENRNLDFYFIPKHELFADVKASFWAGNHDDAIIVEIASMDKPSVNHAFNTVFIPKGKNQRIEILQAWRVSPGWKAYTYDHQHKPVYQIISEIIFGSGR